MSETTVHSDQWAAYNQAQQLLTIAARSTVNHSLHSMDPTTGVHTHNAELLAQGHAAVLPGFIHVEAQAW